MKVNTCKYCGRKVNKEHAHIFWACKLCGAEHEEIVNSGQEHRSVNETIKNRKCALGCKSPNGKR